MEAQNLEIFPLGGLILETIGLKGAIKLRRIGQYRGMEYYKLHWPCITETVIFYLDAFLKYTPRVPLIQI